MEEFVQEVVYPTIEQICEVNRRMINDFGGIYYEPDNIRYRSSLEYILAAIEFPLAGEQLYPTIKEKAAALATVIVAGHVFNDGSKRTGAQITLTFLNANNTPVFFDKTIEKLLEEMAEGKSGYEEMLHWLHEHQS
jgi:death-on-curing protein